MRFGTKILLLSLLIAVGTSATLAWVVTFNLTRYETRRCEERTSQAIDAYMAHLEEVHRHTDKIVRELLESQDVRSLLPQPDESFDAATREQFKQEIFGHTVQQELSDEKTVPAFHVLLNANGSLLAAAAPGDAALEKELESTKLEWPVKAVVDRNGLSVDDYLLLKSGLFLVMGVPLRTQLDEPPSHAYFVGFRVDDSWARTQLLARRASVSADAPLAAWFMYGDLVYAQATSAAGTPPAGPGPATPITVIAPGVASAGSLGAGESISFHTGGEQYVGQWFRLNPRKDFPARLVLASSLDQALQPLRDLQKQIIGFTIAACCVAVMLCRWLARRLARPVQQLVAGTQQIAAGNFDRPLTLRRRDELGQLAVAMNAMAGGLKERDALRDERTKIERDLAVARQIQMGVLPSSIPPCPGYDIATYANPAEQTGGDIFDIVPGDDQSLVLLLADATGHGIGPALSVTQVRAMLRIGVRLHSGLDTLFTQMNRQLCQDLDAGRFVTAFLGRLDPVANTLRYYSAGQAPLLYFRAADRSLTWLEATMTPLGVMEDDVPGVESIALAPGDVFVLLTDGFYEYHNTAGEQFDDRRVGEIVAAHHAEPAAAILNALLAATQAFAAGAPQKDDMTAIILKRLSADSSGNP